MEYQYKTYLKLTIIPLLAYCFTAAMVNIYVDPYMTFPNLSSSKFENDRYKESRISLGNVVANGDFEFAVLGSSRPKNAFEDLDTRYPDGSAFNFSLPSTSIKETSQAATLLFKNNHPKLLLVGVEYDLFQSDWMPAETSKSLISPNNTKLDVTIEQLFGLKTLRDSIDLLLGQGKSPYTYAPSYQDRFKLTLEFFINSYYKFPPPEIIPESRWGHLDSILIQSKENEAKPVLLLLPLHSLFMSLYFELDYWDQYVAWKKELVNRFSDRVEIWDFTGFSGLNAESIPGIDNDNSDMQWFRDPSHCSPAYGDLILDTILSKEPTNLGTILNKENIDKNLANILSEKEYFYKNNPEQINYLRSIILEFKDKNEHLLSM